MTIKEFVTSAAERLRSVQGKIQCADPLLHAKQILEHALRLETSALYLRWENEISPDDWQRAENLLSRRLAGEPFQYLIGCEWFWNSKFTVGPGVLIPRRETEFIVEELLKETAPRVQVAELGAGSGNIGISVCLEKPDWEWHAFEINPETIPYLKNNVTTLLPVGNRFKIHEMDFFQSAALFRPYDWVVSNPPYLSANDLKAIPGEVTFEPVLALDGGDRGTELTKKLVRHAKEILRPGGKFVCEIGMGQDEELKLYLNEGGFSSVHVINDYAQIPRVILATNASA